MQTVLVVARISIALTISGGGKPTGFVNTRTLGRLRHVLHDTAVLTDVRLPH